MERREKRRFLSLDILRGLAALSVLLSHLNGFSVSQQPGLADRLLDQGNRAFHWLLIGGGAGAHPGVVLFIVLSGFCIHLPQANKPQTRFDKHFWQEFAWRRTWRIGPVYWLGVLFGVVTMVIAQHVGSGALPSVYGTAAPGPVLAKLTFVNAWIPSRATELGNVPLRTVAVEAWLYVGYVGVIFLLKRFNWIGVGLGAAGVYLAGIVLTRLGIDGTFIHESFFSFFLYWVMGAFAAECFARDRDTGRYQARAWGGALALFVVNFFAQRVLKFRGAFAITVPILAAATALLLYAVMTGEARLHSSSPLLGGPAKWLAAVGERSYTLYAVHIPAITLACLAAVALRQLGMHWMIFQELPLAIVATLVATLVVYGLVELPSHHLARKMKREPMAVPVTAIKTS